jgi:hypothetical protein
MKKASLLCYLNDNTNKEAFICLIFTRIWVYFTFWLVRYSAGAIPVIFEKAW